MNQPEAEFISLTKDGGYQNAIDTLKNPGYGNGEQPRTLLEIELFKLSGAIRDRKNWWHKLADEQIVSKWREEAGGDSNRAKFDYALAECTWVAQRYTGPARLASVDGVFSCDDISQLLIDRLKAGAHHIRKTSPRDVHPGSDGLVIDLVHPSMYAYEKGVTPVLGGADVYKMPAWDSFMTTKAGKAEAPPGKVDESMCSKAGLAWLPAELFVPESGSVCEINSYINSLHPVIHADVYGAIGDAFLQALPLLEEVCTELGTPEDPYQRPHRVLCNFSVRPQEDPSFDVDPEDYEDNEDAYFALYWASRPLKVHKVPKEFVPPPERAHQKLTNKRLQVIVKMVSIELTPEQPRYNGGSWHVEGMRNERIVATACVYFESDNIGESVLEFRTAVCEPGYEQDDNVGMETVYGLRNQEPLVQPRGTCCTLPGRILAWPNTLQHRVHPFELLDKSRAGRRTILCFFVVDPTLRVRSTATVPPQALNWQEMALKKVISDTLPADVAGQIAKFGYAMSFAEACERRERLMKERKQIVNVCEDEFGDQKMTFFERLFSLCEH